MRRVQGYFFSMSTDYFAEDECGLLYRFCSAPADERYYKDWNAATYHFQRRMTLPDCPLFIASNPFSNSV